MEVWAKGVLSLVQSCVVKDGRVWWCASVGKGGGREFSWGGRKGREGWKAG